MMQSYQFEKRYWSGFKYSFNRYFVARTNTSPRYLCWEKVNGGLQIWEVKFDVTNPNSLFSQMGKDNVNHGVLICAVIERVNYYSRWTSIYRGDWDELQREHCDKDTGFTPDAVPSTILWKQNFETFLLEIST